jgi:hypothetical protein
MSENNLRQADVPVGATPIAQMPGTAPGLVCPVGNKVIYAVPGVPSEMREMMRGTILTDLARRAGQASVIRARVVRTWGMSESGLAEVLAARVDELDRLGNPTIAFQASGIDGIKVRIVAKCDDEATATRLLAEEEALIRGLLGDVVFGIDEQTMETVTLDLLRARGLTLAVSETLTGGILSARMTATDTAMETFRGARISADAGLRRLGRPCRRRPGRGGGPRARHGLPVRRHPGHRACRDGAADARPPPHARVRRDQPAQFAAAHAHGVAKARVGLRNLKVTRGVHLDKCGCVPPRQAPNTTDRLERVRSAPRRCRPMWRPR